MRPALLDVENLTIDYQLRGSGAARFRAVEQVSLSIDRGEAVGLVGESGCGKTSLIRGVLLLQRPSAGIVRFDGANILSATPFELREIRRRMQPIYQNPVDSVQPRMRVYDAVCEPLQIHRRELLRKGYERFGDYHWGDESEIVDDTLVAVGLSAEYRLRLVGELSVGERQRIAIARALVFRPELLVADEITSALDVTVQRKILDLLVHLRTERNLGMLMITHDIGVVGYVCDRIAVMRQGRIVETGTVEQIVNEPEHDYTKALIAAAKKVSL